MKHISGKLTYVVYFNFDRGIKIGCPFIVEIRNMQGCALDRDPAWAIGKFSDIAKAQH